MFRAFLVFNIVSFLWLLFQLQNFRDVLLYLREMTAGHEGKSPQIFYEIVIFGMPVVLYHVWAVLRPRFWEPFVRIDPLRAQLCSNIGYGFLLFLILVNSGCSGSFIYFQF